jgi:hypothetical protein
MVPSVPGESHKTAADDATLDLLGNLPDDPDIEKAQGRNLRMLRKLKSRSHPSSTLAEKPFSAGFPNFWE